MPEGVLTMLGIIWKILCILGLILLILLGLVICVLLLVLFFPVSYRIEGYKEPKEEELLSGDAQAEQRKTSSPKTPPDWGVSAKIKWLLGLLTVNFAYPVPGNLIVKALGFKVFDSAKKSVADKKHTDADKASAEGSTKAENVVKDIDETGNEASAKSDSAPNDSGSVEEASAGENNTTAQTATTDRNDFRLTEKPQSLWEKIIYTIKKICDKIKEIYALADYYISLLREEDTKLLFQHVLKRLGKIFKSIRPRKIKGQLLIGTGSPDTTGYVMALYGMLSPYLGQNLTITPDFDDKIIEGHIFIKGHIIIATLAFHGIRVLLDRRLRTFIKKLKREVK